MPFERSECESECCGASAALGQLLLARRSSNAPRARPRHWRAAGRALCPATGAPSAPEASGHPKWMPMPPPAPSEPCALSVAPAAHDQCPTSAGSTCSRSSSPNSSAQMQMPLAELRASAATKSWQVASWTLEQVGFADAASAASASSPDADAIASLCARVSSSTHCHCLNPVPFILFPAVLLAPPPGHMLDHISLTRSRSSPSAYQRQRRALYLAYEYEYADYRPSRLHSFLTPQCWQSEGERLDPKHLSIATKPFF